MGRRKIEIQPITHERNRSVTFLKRKNGLFKKAYELGVLCSVDVAVIIFNPAGSANKLFEYCSGDLDSIVRRRSDFQGDRDLKTAIDYSGDGRGNGGKSYGGNGGDSDEDEDESDHTPMNNPKGGVPPSNKQKLVAGTRSRPARSTGRNGLQDEKQDVDELDEDSNHSYTRKRSPPSRLSPDEDGPKRMHGRRGDVTPYSRDGRGGRDPRDDNPSDHWPPSPRAHNRHSNDGGFPSAHDILLGASGASALAGLGLPLALNQLVSQLSPQQLASLSPHLNLTPQQQEIIAIQAAKQQEQQLHLRQREQLATLQNTLRGNPNRLTTLNLNLSGLTGLGGLGSLGSLGGGGLANLGGLGSLGSLGGAGGGGQGGGLRDLGGLGLGSSLTGLPIRKMGMGGSSGLPSFPASLSSISSTGPGPQSHSGHGPPPTGNQNLPYPHPLLSTNPNNSGPNSNDQPPPPNGSEEGSWLDFLSFPAGRVDPSSLTGLSALGGLGLGGLMERESATRTSTNLNGNNDHPGNTSSLFDYAFGGGPAPGASGGGGNNNSNSSNSTGGNSNHAAYGSGAASGGGYGLGLGLGLGLPDRERNSRSRGGDGMDMDKEGGSSRDDLSDMRERERETVDAVGDRDDEGGHARKRPRWD